MKIVAISDVHGKWNKISIPECDLLISAGDYSFKGERHMLKDFHKWLNKQPASSIISVNGNHEVWVEQNYAEAKSLALSACPRVHFIQNESVEIDGVKIFGSASTPAFSRGWAWNEGRTVVEAAHLLKPFIGDTWAKIPEDTDILVTHGPPIGILDEVIDRYTGRLENVGCRELLNRIHKLKSLKLHIFGHLHLGGGRTFIENGVTFANASVCDEGYRPNNKIIVIDL